MRIIAAGYSGTGSSAIVHLLSEYEGVTPCINGSYEHVLFYIPDGLFDLEDRLLNNNSIHMSDGAINRFYIAMKRLNDYDFGWFGGYKKRYGNQFMEAVNKFVERITQFKMPGYWSDDFSYYRSIQGIAIDIGKTVLGKNVNQFGYKLNKKGDGIVRYSFISAEEFYCSAQEFVNDYIAMISNNAEEDIVLDQILLPHNLFRMKNYFTDSKSIVFDRDPRDLYVLSKYVWPKIAGSAQLFPITPEEFVDFYRGLKSAEKVENDPNVMRLHFEDLIYRYDETVMSIEHFLDIDRKRHISSKTRFVPEKSIMNTQNFLIDKAWESEVKYIEENLHSMIYRFPYKINTTLSDTSDPQ